MRAALLAALTATGMAQEAATVLADAALVLGASTQGTPIGSLELGYTSPSARAATQAGTRPRAEAAPGSVDAHLHAADTALTGIEALTSAQARLDGALLAATAAQTTATAAALLAQKDLTVEELSTSRRERLRGQAKSRTRAELAPATGWTPGEAAHLVALAAAPVAFSTPVTAQMRRGQLPWRLARALWRACNQAGLDAADAAHIAHIMCADQPDTAVPERLEPDGTVTTGPWNHRAFWTALDREIAKLVHADDADPDDAAAAKAARDAAFTARTVIAKVGQDGMGALTVLLPNFWVAAIKDRLLGAAIAAHAAGDARTTDQLQSDIARTLLAHATIGFADLPLPDTRAGQDITPEDLAAAGWSPELITALSGLPPALLQVIVPLIGLHDPATAHTLPTPGRQATRPDANTPHHAEHDRDPHHVPGRDYGPDTDHGPGAEAGLDSKDTGPEHTGPEHTGRNGCPACLPSIRTRQDGHVHDEHTQHRRDGHTQHSQEHDPAQGRGQDSARPTAPQDPAHPTTPEDSAHPMAPEEPVHPTASEDPAHPSDDPDPGPSPGGGNPDGDGRDRGGSGGDDRSRRLWVGQLLGKFAQFVSPADIRRLALSPGTTMARLLVDPADGRCVERSTRTYLMDAAMRAQILAADVTCRAPGCHHPAALCQIDHVQEHATGGPTSEANGQPLDSGHHEPKTAKDWDADLAANRDVTWTTLLGRIYRTRAWDYRRYVTLLTDAIDTIRSAPPEEFDHVLNDQVYLALTLRELGEKLNPGDDDLEPDITRFGGWGLIGLTRTDPSTGHRAPGPSPAATATAHAAWALSTPRPGTGETDQTHPAGTTAYPAGTTARPAQPTAPPASTTAGTGPGTDPGTTGDVEPGTDPDRGPEAAGRSASPAPAHPYDPGGPGWEDPAGYHARTWSSPRRTMTRIDGRTGAIITPEEERQRRIARRLAYDEGIPPF